MNTKARIFAVDDVESARGVLETTFGASHGIETFETGEACLNRLPTATPDLFLLDVDLPGIDGYFVCRLIKQRPDLEQTPVIFISGLDDLESRLQGYESGGIDFIVKPYDLAELQQKVELALAQRETRVALQQQINDTEVLTSLIMSNLDEYALLIRFLRTLTGCLTPDAVADATLAMLTSFKLPCSIQLRLPDAELTVGTQGKSTPLEASIINHVKNMGTIFEFQSRAAFNYPRVTLLVQQMPLADPDLCGRLRDHLAIAAESIESKLEAMETRQAKARTTDGISALLGSLQNTVALFGQRYDKARYKSTALTQEMLDELSQSFAHLGMSDEQEKRIIDIVRSRAFGIADAYDFGADTQSTLSALAKNLNCIISGADHSAAA